jgi:hypothetical protein
MKKRKAKKRNPYATTLANKCFTPRVVRAKVHYIRNPKHKGKEFGND